MAAGKRTNPRWLAHCKAIGQDPECEWTGGTGAEFMIWIAAGVKAFGQAHPDHVAYPDQTCQPSPPTIINHDEFTKFLWGMAEAASTHRKEMKCSM